MTGLALADPSAAQALAAFARRAGFLERDAVLRVVSRGTRLGCYAATPFDTLALLALALREPAEVDTVVEAGTLEARAAASGGAAGEPAGRLGDAPAEFELPPPVEALRWTHPLPPPGGWAPAGELPLSEVSGRVEAEVAEFRERVEALPATGRGQAVLESIAGEVWGRSLLGDVPSRMAHAARSYGFLGGDPDARIRFHAAGPWRRMDAPGGSVLTRVGPSLTVLPM